LSDMRHVRDDLSRAVADRLTEIQGDETDTAFAKQLGCTREHWSMVKSGRRNASYELIRRAGRIFPEVQLLVMRDLMGEAAEQRAPAPLEGVGA
jgi:hypothetical protein